MNFQNSDLFNKILNKIEIKSNKILFLFKSELRFRKGLKILFVQLIIAIFAELLFISTIDFKKDFKMSAAVLSALAHLKELGMYFI
jgi:hypothetical protein